MPETATAPATPASITEIRCPHCGHDGKTKKSITRETVKNVGYLELGFRYLEDIVSHRHVGELTDFGDGKPTLLIDGFYETGEGYDDGTNPRLECRACFSEFPIPDGIEVDFT